MRFATLVAASVAMAAFVLGMVVGQRAPTVDRTQASPGPFESTEANRSHRSRQVITAAHVPVERVLADDTSVRYRDEMLADDGLTVCGALNAKNTLGAVRLDAAGSPVPSDATKAMPA